MKSLVVFDITGYESGNLRTVKSFDIINGEPIEDKRFDPYDDEIALFPSFENQSLYFNTVLDFEMIFSKELIEEKEFQAVLSLPFFYNKGTEKAIIDTFEKQFPLCPFNMILPIDFKRLDGYGATDCRLIFKTEFPFDSLYSEFLFKEKKFNNVITSNFESESDYKEIDSIKSIQDLNGKTCLLEGSFELGGMYPEIVKLMNEQNKSLKIIKNLYAEPQNLKEIIDCDNLIIQTTGFNHEGLKMLINSFKKLNYVPKRVFFVLEEIYINEPMFENVKFYKFRTANRILEL
jgi:hypothetical protein